jgi:3-oxoacyl-[acyl-carrier-protein] synthase-3
VTNDDLSKIVDTSNEWIETRTGIKERRVSDYETATSDLASLAAKNAIASAKIDPLEIDLIIVATCSPDTLFPSVGAIVQDKIGAKNAGAFDVSAACSGFNFALSIASAYIESGEFKTILVVGADTLTKYVDWTDRSVCVLFGDGAGAVVLKADNSGNGILASYIKAKGEGGKYLVMPGGGSRDPELRNSRFINMNGKEVFKFAVKALEESVEEVLKKAGLSLDKMDLLIPHQANMRIIEHVMKKISLPEKKVYVNLMKYANTSAASIPIALDEAYREGRIKSGDILVLAGFGAGLTYGSNLIKW